MKAASKWSTGEFFGTVLLVIFCTTDERNQARPQILTAATIGLTVTLLISLLGPLTMACSNPARDFAPRLFSSLAGWGAVPFQVNGLGWLTVYIVAPLPGGLLGGLIHRVVFSPASKAASSGAVRMIESAQQNRAVAWSRKA